MQNALWGAAKTTGSALWGTGETISAKLQDASKATAGFLWDGTKTIGNAVWNVADDTYSEYGPHSMGVSANAAGTFSPQFVSIHGEVSGGLGWFSDYQGFQGTHIGGYSSWGLSAGPFGMASFQNPPNNGNDFNLNPSVGAYLGAAPGIWLSNAQRPTDLNNTTMTYSFNFAFGEKILGISWSYGDGIWHLNIQPPSPISPGGGVDLSAQRTSTHGTK